MTAKFASLHAGLLARKGQASPVFVNPAVTYIDDPRPMMDADDDDDAQRRDVASADGLPLMAEKVGGDEVSNGQLTPMLNGGRPMAVRPPRRPRLSTDEDTHGPYRFSFRMPSDQHRRLRVAAAQKNVSLQQALSDALDNYLDGLCACSLKDCTCLAARDDAQKN
jgi:hypothetical protein